MVDKVRHKVGRYAIYCDRRERTETFISAYGKEACGEATVIVRQVVRGPRTEIQFGTMRLYANAANAKGLRQAVHEYMTDTLDLYPLDPALARHATRNKK